MKIIKHLLLIGFFLLLTMCYSFAQRVNKKEKRIPFLNQSTSAQQALRMSNFYTFSFSNGAYTNLTGTTSVNQGQVWDDPSDLIPIGFNFTLYNQVIDTLDFSYGLGGSFSDLGQNYILAPFDLDLIDRGDISGVSQSPISYKIEGAPGSRIFKMEWQNVGSYDEEDSLGTLNDYLNFQMWLYEGSNNVEYHFGNCNFNNTYNILSGWGITGGIIGLYDDLYSDFYLLNGNASAPTMTGGFNNPCITGNPPNGIVYKFTYNPNAIGINENDNIIANVSLFPNPTSSLINIKVNGSKLINAELNIVDVFGRNIKTIKNIDKNEISLNCEEYADGVYFYQLSENNQGLSTGKFIIKK